jgi:hypothetical protein
MLYTPYRKERQRKIITGWIANKIYVLWGGKMGWSNVTDEYGNIYGIEGDEGWDLAGTFVEEFQRLYLKSFGRVATLREIIDSVEFVYDTTTEEIVK